MQLSQEVIDLRTNIRMKGSRLRLKVLTAGIAVVGSGFIWLATPGAVASVTTAWSLPPVPSPTASPATWQAWSAAQDQLVRSVPWAEIVQQSGCTPLSIDFSQVTGATNPGLDIPASASSTTISITAHCPGDIVNPVASITPASEPAIASGGIQPLSIPVGDTCGGVRGSGTQCINWSTYNGYPAVAAS